MTRALSRRSARVATLVLLIAASDASPAFSGLVDTTWVGGGAGLWSGTSNWSSGRPNNNVPSGAIYNALIDGGAVGSSVVTLDMNASITGLWITTGDRLDINNTRALVVAGDGSVGTIQNAGLIRLNSTGGNSDLVVNAAITLGGGGTVSLFSASRIRGSGTLINLDNLIEGQGSIGYNAIAIYNQGLISANAPGGTLTLDPASGSALFNSGTLQADHGATLTLSGNYSGTFNNAGGWIIAADGSQVRLASGAVISGGTLTTSGSGTVAVASSDGTISDLANAGRFVAENGAAICLLGEIANSGSMSLNSTGNATDVRLSGQATLSSGGTVFMSSLARIAGSGTLVNLGNAIVGEGSIGFNQISLINHGLIEASVSGKPLIVDPNSAGVACNLGTMQASNGSTLTLTGNYGGTFDNSGGLIQALEGSLVRVVSQAVITGGTLASQGTGSIAIAGSDGTFADLTITGHVILEDTAQLFLSGTVQNSGSITIDSASPTYCAPVSGNTATLSGSGTINLDSVNAAISGTGTLVNAGNTIRGRGGIGRNTLSMVNQGTIIVSGGTLNLDPPSSGAFTNNGYLKVPSGNTLELDGGYGGGFDGAGSIQIESGATATILGSPSFVAGDILNDGVINHIVTASVGHIDGTGALNIASGTLTADCVCQTTVDLPAAASVVIRHSGGLAPPSRIHSLAMTATSLIDLGDNDLILDYSADSPYSTIRSYIKNAWHNGARDGKGITSSSADDRTFTLGYADNIDIGMTTFDGESVDSTTVLVKYTYYGDANLDGAVDLRDLYQLASHWRTINDNWFCGDFNYDNYVDVHDLTLLAINWQAGVGSPLDQPLDSVLSGLHLPALAPEPVGVCSTALMFLLLRRRSRGGWHAGS